ncbi:MAG: cation:proton antiporter [Methanomethylophilus sp.]
MEEAAILLNMMILLLLGGLCSIIFKKLKMPAIIGYLLTGIILGNYWSGRSADTDEIVDFLSDLGLILMMFGIGMELNLQKLRKTGSFAVMVVMIQVPLMLMGGYLGGMLLGLDSLQCIIFGAIISGSSTAVVTVVLRDQVRLTKEEVETVVLVTVVEDVAQVIILSAITPMMSGSEMEIGSIIWMFIKIILFMVAAMAIGLLLVPRFINWVDEHTSDKNSSEVVLIVSLGLCFLMAWMATKVGLSMAIGSFLMGVIVSQSKPVTKISTMVEPMKEVFMMMFFISIGMEIAPETLVDNIGTILAIYLIYFVLKSSSVILAYYIGNKPMRKSFYASISLVAMGEFAFIIGKEALDAGILSNDFYSAVIGAALVSMILLPPINSKADVIYDFFSNHMPARIKKGMQKVDKTRDSFFNKMENASKNTRKNFRTRLTYTYFDIILIILIEIAFYLATPALSTFLADNSGLSEDLSTQIVMGINFLMLIPVLYTMVFNFKFIERVLLDAERRASAGNTMKRRTLNYRLTKFFVELNGWLLVIFLDFIIILLVPNNVSFLGHLVVAAVASLILVLIYAYSYFRRS